MKTPFLIVVIGTLIVAGGCYSSTCDDRCDDIATQCGASPSECAGDCDGTETACEACFGCLLDNDVCEVEPGGPCVGPCSGCRGN